MIAGRAFEKESSAGGLRTAAAEPAYGAVALRVVISYRRTIPTPENAR